VTTAPKPPPKRPAFEHLIDRPAHLAPCRRCGDYVLAGLVGGAMTRCDPGAIDIHAELIAVLGGKASYDVCAWGLPRRLYLVWRHSLRITAARKYPVVAEHQCNGTGRYPTPAIDLTVPRPVADTTSKPPF
jgi:hypothetical protein